MLNQQFSSVNSVTATAYGRLWTYNRSNTHIVTAHVTLPRVSCSQRNETGKWNQVYGGVLQGKSAYSAIATVEK